MYDVLHFLFSLHQYVVQYNDILTSYIMLMLYIILLLLTSLFICDFLLVHMLLGAIALGVLRAFVAHTMAESKSLWYVS